MNLKSIFKIDLKFFSLSKNEGEIIYLTPFQIFLESNHSKLNFDNYEAVELHIIVPYLFYLELFDIKKYVYRKNV